MLDALFTGGLLSDLERLDRINQIIENSGNNSVQTSTKKMKHLEYCVISHFDIWPNVRMRRHEWMMKWYHNAG